MKKYYSSVCFYITVSATIIFISQNEYKLSQEYQELRQKNYKSDRTMSQNIRGIYLHKNFSDFDAMINKPIPYQRFIKQLYVNLQ